MVKRKCYFIVRGFEFDTPKMTKKMTQAEMVKHAKKSLKTAKENGYDKEITQKDLSRPINAWVYLKNIGLGTKTNCKSWK